MERSRLTRIAGIAVPIVGGMLSQTILNLVDMAMVGTLGRDALAGIGTAMFPVFMAVALVMGLSSGVQAIAARRLGEGKMAETALPLNGGLLLALVIGIPLTVVLLAASPLLFPLLNDNAGVIAAGQPYFDARLFGIVAAGINFAFRGYWTGTDQSGRYLRVLLVIHAANVAISYGLIFGKFGLPRLGTEGAGLGTTISLFLGAGIFMFEGWRTARPHGFLRAMPSSDTMASLLRLALPTAARGLLFAAGFTALFWIIGQIGATEVAATTVLINLVMVAILPCDGLGMAALTLVSEALGRKDPDDASRWAWDVAKIATAAIALLVLPALIMPDLIVAGFTNDASVIAVARNPLRVVAAMMVIDGTGIVLLYALMGAGAARQVMMVVVASQWLIGLPLAWLAGPYLALGFFAVWLTQGAYRIVQTGIFVALWRRRGWAEIKI